MKNFFLKVKAFFVKKEGGERSFLTKQAIAIIAGLLAVAIILPIYEINIRMACVAKLDGYAVGFAFIAVGSIVYFAEICLCLNNNAPRNSFVCFVNEDLAEHIFGNS